MVRILSCPLKLVLDTVIVPSFAEIDFIIEVLDKVASPALDQIERLLESAGKWDSADRNDFCRYVPVLLI